MPSRVAIEEVSMEINQCPLANCQGHIPLDLTRETDEVAYWEGECVICGGEYSLKHFKRYVQQEDEGDIHDR